MTEAQQALADGIADSVAQHGTTVTVDGGLTFSAVVNGISEGNVPSDFGMRQVAGATMHFPRASWTPRVGKRVTARGVTLVVESIDYTDPSAYAVTLAEGNQ